MNEHEANWVWDPKEAMLVKTMYLSLYVYMYWLHG